MGSLSGGLCLGFSIWGSLSGESLSRGVSVQRGLCLGGLCLGGSLSREVSIWGSLSGESLSRGVSVQRGLCLGGLCLGGSLSRGSLLGRPPYSKELAVRILLECIFV